jgi:flagellar biosynthetic protein FliR
MLPDDYVNTAFAAFLVFARVGAMLMLLPAVAEPGVPTRARLTLALMVSLLVAPGVRDLFPPMPAEPFSLAGLIVREVLTGLAFGAALRIVLSAIATAGQVIAMQTGLGMAIAFDPAQGQQNALFGVFLNVTAIAFIFATGLHLVFLAGVRGVYDIAPPTGPVPLADFAEMGLVAFVDAFRIGVQIAAPLIVFGLVFYLSLGVLSRLMPQAQIFFIAMPTTILLGLAIFAATLGGGLLVWADYAREFALGLTG